MYNYFDMLDINRPDVRAFCKAVVTEKDAMIGKQIKLVRANNYMERELIRKGNTTFYNDGEHDGYVVCLEPGTFARWLIHRESLIDVAEVANE